MSTRSRFPAKDADFDTYLSQAVAYLSLHAVRLLVAAERITALTDLKLLWDTAFATSQNPNLSTKTSRDEKRALRAQLEELLRTVFDDLPKSLLTIADRNTLNLPERDRIPTPRPAITTAPGVILQARAGCAMAVECRVADDSSRPSMHPHSNGLECRYSISAQRPGTGGPPMPPSTGPTPDPAPAAAQAVRTSTRAKFTIQLAEADAGRYITLQARWVNHVDPAKSGPWSNPVIAMVGA